MLTLGLSSVGLVRRGSPPLSPSSRPVGRTSVSPSRVSAAVSLCIASRASSSLCGDMVDACALGERISVTRSTNDGSPATCSGVAGVSTVGVAATS